MIKTPASKTPEQELDEALTGTFPASDPVAIGHSEHAGVPVRAKKQPQPPRPGPPPDLT
ncbi:MAG: hypothetical protein ACT4SY_11935 [Hyphomicrobiales bacterium]